MSNIDDFMSFSMNSPTCDMITDKEWSELVKRYLNPGWLHEWYVAGYQDGQQAALQEAVRIVSATSRVVTDDGTRRIIVELASVMSLLVSDITGKHVAAGLVS